MCTDHKSDQSDSLLTTDWDRMAPEQKIAQLLQWIETESAKPDGEADPEFLAECSGYLEELTQNIPVCSNEKKQALLEQIRQRKEPNRTTSASPSSNCIGRCEKQKRKRFRRLLVAFAAILALLFSIFSMVAIAHGGYGRAWDFIEENIGYITNMKPGETWEKDNMTIIKPLQTDQYGSIEELREKEGISPLYPAALPGGHSVRYIQKITESETVYSYIWVLSAPETYFQATNRLTPNLQEFDVYATYLSHGQTFYILQFPEGNFQANMQYGELEYTVNAPSYEDLILIIDHMEGY